MAVLDLVEVALRRAGRPLRVKEITDYLLTQGLWESDAKRPWESVGASIYVDIKLHGSESRFVKIEPGVFALSSGVLEPRQDDRLEIVQEQEGDRNRLEKTGMDGIVGEQPMISARRGLSFTDAAVEVLRDHANGQPMHYREITEKAIAEGLIVSQGKTPEASLLARIGTEIERDERRGNPPRFVKEGPGLFRLWSDTDESLTQQIHKNNAEVRAELRKQLMSMEPADFEYLTAQLLAKLGLAKWQVTQEHHDGGIDLRGTMVVADVIEIQLAVQVKRWRRNVAKPTIQKVRGALCSHERGLVVTTSGFTPGAQEEAVAQAKVPIALMDGKTFVDLLIEHEIGVKKIEQSLFVLDKESLKEASKNQT